MALKVLQPNEWQPNTPGNLAISLAGELFEIQTGNKSWSISSPDNNAIRFELRDGDTFGWDASVGSSAERTELSDKKVIPNGTAVELNYGFNLEPGAPNTAYFMALGQFHQDNYPGALPWAPPFSFSLEGERFGVFISYSDANGNPVSKNIFTDVADIQRGHFYDLDVKAVFDPNGNGRLVVTRDGVTLVDYSGPLGYVQQNGVYWKEGIYRHSNATETIAATYKDLTIKTGDAVKFPAAGSFIDAPVVKVDAVSAAGKDGLRTVSLSGSAKAGTTVTFTENGKVVGTAKVDANGHFETKIQGTGTGTHLLSVKATDATGRDGINAVPTRIEISTAADIVARLETIAKDPGLATIVLTDTSVLTVASQTQMNIFNKSYAATMAKIAGDYSFLVTSKVTGQYYDRIDEAYNSKGILTERLRYSDSKLIYDETILSDTARTLRTWKSDGTSDYSEIKNGVTTNYTQFDAKGKTVFVQTIAADGTKELDYYNAAGAIASTKVYKPNGERVETTLGITGQNYTKQAFTFDKAGKMIAQERFNDAGTKILAKTFAADGSSASHSYDAKGVETGFTLIAADGSRADGVLGITGQSYTSQISYTSASGTMTTRDRYDAAGHLLTEETFGAKAAVKTFAYDAKGALTGWTIKFADKTSTVATVYSGTDKVASTISYDAKGNVTGKAFYDKAGNTITDPGTQPSVPPAAGETKTYAYDGSGQKIGVTIKAADGTTSVVKFATGKETVYQHVDKYGATGKLIATEDYDAAGRIAQRVTYAANGNQQTDRYDVSGKVVSQTLLHDGVRQEVSLAVSGKAYATQDATYDAADKLLTLKRAYADGKPAFEQTVAADGSQIVKQWAGNGTMTLTKLGANGGTAEIDQFDAAGHQLSAELRKADGAREWHYFDPKTGLETSSITIAADKTRVEANYAVANKPYATQIATYDAKGQLLEMKRAYADGTLAFDQIVHSDGTAETHSYDTAGREVSAVLVAGDGSRDTFAFTYATAPAALAASLAAKTTATAQGAADPTSVQKDHYGANNVKQWTDLTKADGSHVQTALVGSTLASHQGVADTLVGSKASDTFVFAAQFGKDTVSGFQASTTGGHDIIAIEADLVADYAHLLPLITQKGADTLITLSPTDTILIKNVAPKALAEADFKFFHHDVLHI
ncbi:hypothetical protein GCM10011390_20010 [Aureimonas endophytica]|uniref:Bacterial Ig domain-containing protein n=1 Tax=Aureimonas endophytica TaxID=2027858 RepID=A0A916ZKV0_9HYPH|nr:heparin lyase I family protein [Aureimonas endophytica]GGE01156.1 hypothetical protein GCM10011390_20010 [Aureimonas endophytica]